MAAFRAALRLGFRYLELDVRTSRDGEVLVFHDECLDRSTDGMGNLHDLTSAQLREVRIGGREPLPTLEELLLEWPDVHLNVDVKDNRGVAAVARLIEKHQAHDRVLVASFSDLRRLRVLRKLSRPAASSGGALSVALLLLLGPLGLSPLIRRLARIDCVQVPLRRGPLTVVTPAFIRRCHRAGIQVHVWTLNTEPAIEAVLELGVDGVMTDRADILARVLSARNAWPQRAVVQGQSPNV